MTLNVATVDEQRMASIEEGFNFGQQWNIAHGVFLVANKEKREVNPWVPGWLDCGCRRLCHCGCQRRKDVFGRFGSSPLKSTILALEGAFSTRMGVSILALHPAPLCNFESRLDIQ
jgi:hypothetical protein